MPCSKDERRFLRQFTGQGEGRTRTIPGPYSDGDYNRIEVRASSEGKTCVVQIVGDREDWIVLSAGQLDQLLKILLQHQREIRAEQKARTEYYLRPYRDRPRAKRKANAQYRYDLRTLRRQRRKAKRKEGTEST